MGDESLSEESDTDADKDGKNANGKLEDTRASARPSTVTNSNNKKANKTQRFFDTMRTISKSPTKPIKDEVKEEPQSSTDTELTALFSKLEIRFNDSSVKVTKERIYSIAFHPSNDSILVAAGDKKGMLAFWDAGKTLEDPHSDSHVVFQFQPHLKPISAVRYLPTDHSKLYTASYDGSVRIMDVNAEVFREVFVHPNETWITSFDFHPTTPYNIWFSDGHGFVGTHDTRTPSPKTIPPGQESMIEDDASSRDPMSGSEEQGNDFPLYALSDKKISCISLHPTDPNYLLASGLGRNVMIFDIRNFSTEKDAEPVVEFNDYAKSVSSAHWYPDGKGFVTLSYDDTIRFYPDAWKASSGITKNPLNYKATHNNQTGACFIPLGHLETPKLILSPFQVVGSQISALSHPKTLDQSSR